MAEIKVGQASFSCTLGTESTWLLWTRNEDAVFGPHIGLQKDVRMLYITLNDAEIRELIHWGKVALGEKEYGQ